LTAVQLSTSLILAVSHFEVQKVSVLPVKCINNTGSFVMSVCKFGFFSKEKSLKCQNMEAHLNLLAANLKNNTLRRMLCAYIQQELFSLTTRNLSNEAKVKKKRLTRVKFNVRKRRAKKRLIVQNKLKLAPFPGQKKLIQVCSV
jgi:hypothetical protein